MMTAPKKRWLNLRGTEPKPKSSDMTGHNDEDDHADRPRRPRFTNVPAEMLHVGRDPSRIGKAPIILARQRSLGELLVTESHHAEHN